MEDVINFFHEQGITIVTIQPEFNCYEFKGFDCMMKCVEKSCLAKHCCNSNSESNEKSINKDKLSPKLSIENNCKISQTNLIKSKSLQNIKNDNDINLEYRGRSFSDNVQPIRLRQFISDSHLPKNDNRPVSELDEEFESKLNAEMFDIDKVGKCTEETDNKFNYTKEFDSEDEILESSKN